MKSTRTHSRRQSLLTAPLLAISILVVACGSPSQEASQNPQTTASPDSSASPSPSEEQAQEEVEIYLLQEGSSPYERDSYVAVTRSVNAESAEARLRAATQELLKGATPRDESEGFVSIFSAETASMLNDVTLAGGKATINFKDLRAVIPQAGAAEGGAVFLQQLNATVFAFEPVQEVEYQIEGSCDAFWEWLQSVCFTLTESDWESGRNPLEDK